MVQASTSRKDKSADWQADFCHAVGSTIQSLSVVSGGDFAQSFCAHLDDGRRVFIKTHQSPPAHFFTTEAAGLGWLREAGAIKVPEVLGVSDDPPWLALEWVPVNAREQPGSARNRAVLEAGFGRNLAQLHAAGAAQFGRADARRTGSLGVPNTPNAQWSDFYAHCRLLPLARLAGEREVLSQAVVNSIERLAERLPEWGAVDEPPARLHGDLWAGNRVVDVEGRSWILDPAAHGGHREFDLSMMRLFGGFGSEAFAAYQEVSPLAPGWPEREPLHQLAPLIVHAIKFGGGYVQGVSAALAHYT